MWNVKVNNNFKKKKVGVLMKDKVLAILEKVLLKVIYFCLSTEAFILFVMACGD